MDEALSAEGSFVNFIDIGCGKGKQCIYARKYYKFAKSYGIDFSSTLVEIANNNLTKVGYKNIEFICADAAEWKILDGDSVVFLFNPFNNVILEKFLLNNIDHFKSYNSVIAYANDIHIDLMQELGFEIIYRFHRNSLLKYRRAISI